MPPLQVAAARPNVWIKPAWPGVPYHLACTKLSTHEACASLGSQGEQTDGCMEPERDTQEVITSFLSHCRERPEGCLYVDLGCNLGYFAAQALSLGAHADCVEPQPFFTSAIHATALLNDGWRDRLRAYNAFVGAKGQGWHMNDSRWDIRTAEIADGRQPSAVDDKMIGGDDAFRPCNVGVQDAAALPRGPRGRYHAPQLAFTSLLLNRSIDLLKLDIDSFEGALLGEAVNLIATNATSIQTMLIELGDDSMPFAACESHQTSSDGHRLHCNRHSTSTPRGGNVNDLWRLQHELGYSIWRTNIATNREIYSWRGENLNDNMSPQQHYFEPYTFVRGMRKIERLLPSTPFKSYSSLLRRGQSVLITREPLEQELYARHNAWDLAFAKMLPMASIRDKGGSVTATMTMGQILNGRAPPPSPRPPTVHSQ